MDAMDGTDVVELTIDVTEAADLGEAAHVTATVVAPPAGAVPERPVVAFARAGVGFARGYYTERLPGQATSQAAWHAARGWIVVAVDHLGTGGSSRHDAAALTHARLAAAGAAADRAVVARLAEGTLVPGLPPIGHEGDGSPVRIGLGQSMGGSLTVVQQAHHRSFHGIAVLGYSAVHTHPPVPPGEDPVVIPWTLRGEPSLVLNRPEVGAADARRDGALPPGLTWLNWQFYGDEVDPSTFGDTSRWTTDSYPGIIRTLLTPGVIAAEAAAVRGPVLVAVGERDVVPDLKAEVHAYRSTSLIDLFVCPRMAHMHNFAPTAPLLWERLHSWGTWVRTLTDPSALPASAPSSAPSPARSTSPTEA
jgi:hypothetical protein